MRGTGKPALGRMALVERAARRRSQLGLIRKAVIPAAGLGTRLLSVTKEQPKEMLPVFTKGSDGALCVKPIVQLVFEQLFEFGFREFCFIVGRGKRAIEDHFTPDRKYVEVLSGRGKGGQASELEEFYRKIKDSSIVWANQPEPKGFGHAVLQARPFIGQDEFLVHAGDTYIISEGNDHLARLLTFHRKHENDATLVVQAIEDPRQYGVIEHEGLSKDGLRVRRVLEKPKRPPTNLAVMPIYVFSRAIFRALDEVAPDKDGELQLTGGIQRLVEWGLNVRAISLRGGEIRLDIGTPQTYWEAQGLSYKHSAGDG